MGEYWSFQQMVLGQLDIHMQNNSFGPPPPPRHVQKCLNIGVPIVAQWLTNPNHEVAGSVRYDT